MASSVPEGAPHLRLLFVDDETLLLQGLKRSLHGMRAQWHMSFAEGGAQALATLEREQFDAIITDMRMPGMDGAQLLGRVKEKYPEIVRIVLSGQADRESMLRSLGPAHQYVSKPCDPVELRTKLSQAFVLRDRVNTTAMRALACGLKSIPSPPSLYRELQAELKTEAPSLDEVAKTVRRDPGMTAKVLQLANSAFIGTRHDVTSAIQAVTLIGIEMLRALTFSVQVFSESPDGVSSHCAMLGDHSIAVANLCARIAACEGCSQSMVEECFTAGLLHDVGKLILLAAKDADSDGLLKSAQANAGNLGLAEQQNSGCSAAELGAYLLSIWGLPPGVVHAVAHYERPVQSGEKGFSSLTVVHVANAVVSSSDPASTAPEKHWDREYLRALGLIDRQAVWLELYEERV